LEQWRGRGLAAWLVTHAIKEAYQNFADLEIAYLDSSPMAQSICKRIGVVIVGWINTFKHGN